jgi:hypothetical protein
MYVRLSLSIYTSRKYHPHTIEREERYHGSLKLEYCIGCCRTIARN